MSQQHTSEGENAATSRLDLTVNSEKDIPLAKPKKEYPSLSNYKEPEDARLMAEERKKLREELREHAQVVAELNARTAELEQKRIDKTLTATDKRQARTHGAKCAEAMEKLNALLKKDEDLKAKRIALYKAYAKEFAEAYQVVVGRLLNKRKDLSHRWIESAMNHDTKVYGPVKMPLTAKDTQNVLQSVITFETPYDAVTWFVVMTLRTAVRRGKLAVSQNHSLLSKVLHKCCLFERKLDENNHILRVKSPSFKMVQQCAKNIASFIVGAVPENAYNYNENGEGTTTGYRVAFDWAKSGGASYSNHDGAEFEVYVHTSGALPLYPSSRPIQLRFSDGSWKVYQFASITSTILPPKDTECQEEVAHKDDAADDQYVSPKRGVQVDYDRFDLSPDKYKAADEKRAANPSI